jgi:outer membrane autotransporter protein
VIVTIAFFVNPDSAEANNDCGVPPIGPGANIVCDATTYSPTPDGGIVYTPTTVESHNLTIDLGELSVVRQPVSRFAAIRVHSLHTTTENVNIDLLSFAEIRPLVSSGETFDNGGYGVEARQNGNGSATIVVGRDVDRLGELGTIETVGREAHGVFATIKSSAQEGNAHIIMNGGAIQTQGGNARGLYSESRASSGAAIVELNGGRIHVDGDLSENTGVFTEGVLARVIPINSRSNAIIIMRGGDISKAGTRGAGLFAWQQGLGEASINIEGGRISTTGERAFGAWATVQQAMSGQAIITMTNGEVATIGNRAAGLYAGSFNGVSDAIVSMTGGNVVTIGDEANGVQSFVQGSGTSRVSLTGGSILAQGDESDAVFAGSTSGNVVVNVDMLVRGGWGNSDGVFVTSGAAGSNAIDIGTGGYVTAASDSAVRAASGATNVTNVGTILGTVNLSDGDDTFANNSANSWNIRQFADTDGDGIRDEEAVAVNDFGAGRDTVTNGANGVVRLLTVEDRSGFTATADDDTAPTDWDQATVVEYSVPGAGSIEAFGVEQAHLLNLEFFENAGLITMADSNTGGVGPVAGDVIVITGGTAAGMPGGGEFVSNGGRLHIDTVLNNGQVASSDVLVIDRSVLGSRATAISVANAGGSGGLTDLDGNGQFDAGEGILIVRELEGDQSGEGAFVLDGPVLVGVYRYFLDRTDGQSWFLQSDYYEPAVAYEVYQSGLLNLMTLPTLMDRVGNRVWAVEATAFGASEFVFCKDPEQNFSCPVTPEQATVFAGEPVSDTYIEGQGVWVQVDGTRIQYDADSGTTGASYDATIAGLQVGYDHVLMENADGDRLIGGVKLRYQTSNADVTNGILESEISSTGLGLGGSLTWYDVDGLYVDAQAQVMTIETDMSASGIGQFVDGERLTGYSFALEVGKEIPFDDTITITPQVQLSYATATEDGFTDEQGLDVSFEAESIKLRAGVEVSQAASWKADDGTTSRRDVTVGAHVTKEFVPETSIDVSGTILRSETDDTTGEITLGGTYNWSDDRYSVYGKVGTATGLNSFGETTQVSGTVGMRLQWE